MVLDYNKDNLNELSFEDARKLLKEWRDSGARNSEDIIDIWELVLQKNRSGLGDELWIIYEQLCFAAIDRFEIPIVDECLKTLNGRFPNSPRVLKLKAMFYEAQGRYDAALKIYNGLIDNDPTNNGIRKRKVALFLAQSKRLEAIRELNDYLQVFLNDSEAWLQLSELFLTENDLPKAVHCLEECVLISPLNTLFLRRLADLRYCQGGQDNIELAKSYYDQTIKLNPKDLRALYGIVLCTNYLVNHFKGAVDKKKESIAVGTGAMDKIINIYKSTNNPGASTLISAVEQARTALTTVKQ